MKIITAINNPKLNDELKNEKNIEIICKDIFYKEGILEILENEINIDYIIINSKLEGEIKLNKLIEKIIEKNEKIKIIILIKKENKNNFYKLKNTKDDNIEIIKDIKNKNIIRIFYSEEINLDNLKNYKKTRDYHEEELWKEDIKARCKKVVVLGERQVGKSMTIAILTKKLAQKNKKILIIEMNKNDSDLLLILRKKISTKKIVNKKRKVKNKFIKINKKYFNKKNKLKIIKKLIIKLDKNIDIISYKKIIKINTIKKLEKNYNYIFIEINLEKNNFKNNKKIKNINEKILIIRPNLLGIKNTKKIIEKNNINNFKIIINNYNIYSVDEKIIEKIFNKNKIIEKINYKKEYYEIINNNIEISCSILEKINKINL